MDGCEEPLETRKMVKVIEDLGGGGLNQSEKSSKGRRIHRMTRIAQHSGSKVVHYCCWSVAKTKVSMIDWLMKLT